MKLTLWRAADDDYVTQGISFAESLETAKAYLDNGGFGGENLYQADIDVEDAAVLDWTEMDVERAAGELELSDPGAIGLEEWIPRSGKAIDALESRGYLWVKVAESYPEDTTTWIWVGSWEHDPELVQIA